MKDETMQTCTNQHIMSEDDQFCKRCGQPAVPDVEPAQPVGTAEVIAPAPQHKAPPEVATSGPQLAKEDAVARPAPEFARGTTFLGDSENPSSGIGTSKALLLGSLVIATAILFSALMLALLGPAEESDAYKAGYDSGYNHDYSLDVEDLCAISDTNPLILAEDRTATPQENEDYEQGCRDGYGDG